MSNFYSAYGKIQKLEQAYNKQLRKNPFYTQVTNQLKDLDIDVLFCTHQRALKAAIIFAAAKDLGIKTYTVIYSWDNVPKARLALKADYYLVWSNYMQAELIEFYPEIKPEQVVITGTPQFEVYSDPKVIISKETFYNSYSLDPQRKIICFSGDDEYTSPKDPEYLRDLAQGIIAAGKQQEYQILFRRCPVDVSGRYQAVINTFPELIKEAPPLWNFNSAIWSAVYPTQQDVSLLVSVAYYCDAVVNVGSTMAFDFGMFNKPCIYINYDQPNAAPWSVDSIYNFQHFRSMPNKEVVLWWNSKDDVPQLLTKLEANMGTTVSDWFSIIVAQKDSSEAIYKALTTK